MLNNNSVIHNLSAGAERIKSILENNGEGSDTGDETHNNQFDFRESNNESTDLSSLECSYADAHILEEKLKLLNVYIDKLISVNTRLKHEKVDTVNEKAICEKKIAEMVKDREKLELELKEACRTVDLLQEQLNEKHLQLSALKTRLDGTSCLDINQMKSSVADVKRKLILEQEKNDQLNQTIDGLQCVIDEKTSRISQLVNELQSVELEKMALEAEISELMKDKQNLLDEKHKLERRVEEITLDREVDAEQARAHLETSNEASNMIPQLMQLVIRDKNDEINELVNQLREIEDRLHSVIHTKESDVLNILDELISNYINLKEQFDLRLNMTSPVTMFSQCRSLSPTPHRPMSRIHNEMTIKTEPLSQSSTAFDSEERKRSETEFHELQIKCDRMYFVMNNLKEENDILKLEIENLKENDKWHDMELSLPSTNANEAMDKDSDFIDEEDSIEDALIKIHKQSAELLSLSEAAKAHQNSAIRSIIDILPQILINEDDNDNIKEKLVSDEKAWQSFLQNFSCKNLGNEFLERCLQIQRVYKEAREKIKFYLKQNETISSQLSSVEEALIQAQNKLDMYQKKYEKVKKKLKERSTLNGNSNGDSNQSPPKAKGDCDHAELYHQYRRCLSHRNSLIYQKKYLLNVLGGYQLPEKATLALLANLDVTTNESTAPFSGRLRFKSIVIAVIAINRMNYIHKRHSSYPSKKIDSPFSSHIQPKSMVPTSPAMAKLSSHPSPNLIAKYRASSRCETNATIEEFVTRLQRLHRTLGLRYEARQNSGDTSLSDD